MQERGCGFQDLGLTELCCGVEVSWGIEGFECQLCGVPACISNITQKPFDDSSRLPLPDRAPWRQVEIHEGISSVYLKPGGLVLWITSARLVGTSAHVLLN